jgi:ketosteroid isomerase-like protein
MSATAAETTTSSSAASAMSALIEPWCRASVTRDWDALLSFCTDDVTFAPPNEPLVEGPAARPWLEGFPTIVTMGWGIDHLEETGDQAWLRGWVRMTFDVSGQAVNFDGKYTDVARRGTDGTWRIAHVMWSSNEAAPTT